MCFWQIPHILQYASAVHKQLVATCGYVVSDHWPHRHRDKGHYKTKVQVLECKGRHALKRFIESQHDPAGI